MIHCVVGTTAHELFAARCACECEHSTEFKSSLERLGEMETPSHREFENDQIYCSKNAMCGIIIYLALNFHMFNANL